MSMVQRREHERWEREADDAYSKHVIARSGKGFVYLKRPDSGCLAVELILGGWGTLIVIGDGPDMMFRSYRKGTLRSALEWVGHSGAGYISSKVVCGRRSLYSGALAHADYRAYIDGNWPASDAVDANGEVDEEVEGQRRLRLALLDDDCIPWFEDDIISRGEVEKAIYQIEEDAEVLPVGVYASFDFRNARAACRRALELMGTQDAELSLDTGDNESLSGSASTEDNKSPEPEAG